MPRLTLALPICGCALALAACGGSSGLTKAQYDAKVSRLCLVAADQFRELHMDYTVGSWRHSGPEAVRIARHFDRAVAALKAPSSIASEAAAYLRANQTLVVDYQGGVTAAKTGNLATVLEIDHQISRDGAATAEAAQKIGATGCYIG